MSKDLRFLSILLLLSVILRFFSFFPSVIDHDESTYLIIGNELLKGATLYEDVTDLKPVGIFYITAAFIGVFGRTIFGFRVFTAFIIALISFLIYKTKLRIGHQVSVARASAIIYIFFISVWTHYGVTVNTEHFFSLFTMVGVYVIFTMQSPWRIPLTALIMGLGLLIKPVVVGDFAAIILFLFITDILKKTFTFRSLMFYFISGIAFLTPFALVNLAFFVTGHFEAFYGINYVAFSKYGTQTPFHVMFMWVLEFLLRFLPVTVLFFWALFTKHRFRSIMVNEKLFVLIWLVFCMFFILWPAQKFGHYMIQAMLPMAFLAGNIFSEEVHKPRFVSPVFGKKAGYSILAVLIVLNLVLQYQDHHKRGDCPRESAAYISQFIRENDMVYTANTQQIVYFLLNTSPPTKYVHTSLIFDPRHCLQLGINADTELKKILDKQPRFILVKSGRELPPVLGTRLQQNYKMLKRDEVCGVDIHEITGK